MKKLWSLKLNSGGKKGRVMSYRLCLLLPLLLAGCAKPAVQDAPKPPQVGMANPAAVYCQQKGKVFRRSMPRGSTACASCQTVKLSKSGRYGVAIIRRKNDSQWRFQ
jgi:putative hemolysin